MPDSYLGVFLFHKMVNCYEGIFWKFLVMYVYAVNKRDPPVRSGNKIHDTWWAWTLLPKVYRFISSSQELEYISYSIHATSWAYSPWWKTSSSQPLVIDTICYVSRWYGCLHWANLGYRYDTLWYPIKGNRCVICRMMLSDYIFIIAFIEFCCCDFVINWCRVCI